MPTSTDLVTDLPADFETFGQAVATSMADLLGGTTGQVLSKASNTNMDFTWVTTDDANAIQNSIVDAKGDLIAASAADTPARLAVGANNSILTADSAEATGLKWDTGVWTAYTVGLSNFSLGNGTLVSRYKQIGKTVFVNVWLRFGSTTTLTGAVQGVLPSSVYANAVVNVNAYDASTNTTVPMTGNAFGTNFGAKALNATGTYAYGVDLSSTIPFTWTTNDEFNVSITYEVA
jgi:hypothetical protein